MIIVTGQIGQSDLRIWQGGANDRLVRGLGIKPGDVLRNRAFEQFDVLRQIADVLAEPFRRPLVERGAVERARRLNGTALASRDLVLQMMKSVPV